MMRSLDTDSSVAYRRYALAAMTAVYTLNLVDRGLMGLLLQPIKEDLQLSDTQLGFVTGIAFALFYAVMGVPLARWADRGNRVTLTALAIGLWGVTVMTCLFVTNFVQLVFARIAAAVGEAGCKPPTYSLVGDYFPQAAERTRAMAVYWTGGPLSNLISFIAGGWLAEIYGWRVAFFVMGVPGLILALIFKFTIAEPRATVQKAAAPQRTLPPIKIVLTTFWRLRSCRNICIAMILVNMISLGMWPWFAAFMMRSHDMETGTLGLWLGSIFTVGGIIGVSAGGYFASRWFTGNERGQMRMCALAVGSVVPCFAAFLLLADKYHALIALGPLAILFSVFLGPTYAILQRLVPDDMRATTMAIMMLLANLIGMGLGPQVVGILSDLLAPSLGNDSLRYAMLSLSLVALGAAYYFWQTGKTVAVDLRNR